MLLLIAATIASVVLTGAICRMLHVNAILDHPNERSSHTVPTPRGGGWGILLVLVPAWAVIGVTPWIIAGIALLAAISWRDDRRSLGAVPRLLAQCLAVAAGLVALGDGLVFQGWLPDWADHAVVSVSWLWFINVFNFMDGIDGLAGSEAVSIAGGLALVATLAGPSLLLPSLLSSDLVSPSLILTGAALGFLRWNWQPAKVFMGDVGSVPLGFAIGWLLTEAAVSGLWLAALLLPLYFLSDATITLLRRLLAGRCIWLAHSEHFYQRAVQNGRSHAQVVRSVIAVNSVLIGLVLAAPVLGWPVLVGGALVVLMLIRILAKAPSLPPQ
ncbi:MAG: glycosyltransferase family 4 protein [Rhodospirillaceae bacterium]